MDIINIGASTNDGTGDTLREAFDKVNKNFAQISISLQNANGSAHSLFKGQIGNALIFKNLSPGKNISISDNTNVLSISASDNFSQITAGNTQFTPTVYPSIVIQGGSSVSVNTTLASNVATITLDNTLPIVQYLTTYDFGTIGSPLINVIQMILMFTNIDFGTITNPCGITLDNGHL